MANAENTNSAAKTLVAQIHNAAIPQQKVLNRFQKTEPHLPATGIINGNFSGYVIQYDWSGNNVVSSKKLFLQIIQTGNNHQLKGKWLEEGTDSVDFFAALRKDSLVFINTWYNRKDHYSPDIAIQYNFENAALNLLQKGNTVYLAGTVQMFSPDRNEPSKPLFIALVRSSKLPVNTAITKSLNAYPNPFTSFLNIEFELLRASKVNVELLTESGVPVYHKYSEEILSKGKYNITIQPGQLASGAYLLKLGYDNANEIIKVIKK